MFIDDQFDALLIRDVFGPQYYCRKCFHYTYLIAGDLCAWCKSSAVGGWPRFCKKERAMGMITEPEDREPTKHQRLKDGWALLKAAE